MARFLSLPLAAGLASCVLLLAPLPASAGTGEASQQVETAAESRSSRTVCKKRKKKRRKKGRKGRGKKKKTSSAPKNTPPPAAEPAPAAQEALPLRGPARIDFDDRLIQGQTNKTGAVVLFARKKTGIKSMVKRRRSFREYTLRTIYDQ